MKKWLIISLFLCILSAYGEKCNVMLFQRVSNGSTPKIDGILTSGEWSDAAMLPTFSFVSGDLRQWEKQQEIMLKFDHNNLYIGFRTYMEIDMALAPQESDSKSMENVESLDIRFIIPGQKKWERFMVERGGQKFDQLIRGHKMDDPKEWNPEWTYRSRLLPQDFASWSIWEGEIAIPWKSLGMKYPDRATEIAAMFIRHLGNVNVSSSSGVRDISWNPVSNIWDLIFDAHYGTLMLEPDKPILRLKKLANYSRSVIAIQGQLVGPGATRGGRLDSAVWERNKPKHMFDYSKAEFSSDIINWQKTIKVSKAEPASGRLYIYDADGGPVFKYPFSTTILPAFSSKAIWNQQTDIVHFAGQTTVPFQNGDKIKYSLESAEGKTYIATTHCHSQSERFFDAELNANQIPDSTEFIAVAALYRNGNRAAVSQNRIKKEFPPWHKNVDTSLVTAPPPGWEKVKLDQKDSKIKFEICDHAYIFGSGPLPEQVQLHHTNFSNGAWHFTMVTANGPQKFSGPPPHITSNDDRGYSLTYTGSSPDLKLKADIRVEFDGLAYYRCRFIPKHGKVMVKELALSCPLRSAGLRYMNSSFHRSFASSERHALIGTAKLAQPQPEPEISINGGISVTGWKYTNSFNHFYWIGGDDRGCFFILPSQRNLSVNNRYNQVKDTPERFDFSLELVNRPTAWNKPIDYEFGFILAPTRQALNPSGLRRVGQFILGGIVDRTLTITDRIYTKDAHIASRFFQPDGEFNIPQNYFYGDMIASWIMRDVQDGNFLPDTKTQNEIKQEAVGIVSGHHGKPVLWYDALITPPQKAVQPYLDEWRTGPVTNLPADTYVTLVCASGDWPNAYLYGLKNRFKDGVRSVYIDMSGWRSCNNRLHGCGYYDDNGNLQPTLPFLAVREMFLKLQKAIKENDPDGIIVYHGSNIATLWADIHLNGESWQYAPNYRTLTPEFFQMTMFTPRQTGSRGYFFPALIYRHVPGALRSDVSQEDVIGLSLIHDSHCWNTHSIEIYGNYITTKPLLDFNVDAPDSKWLPYWRNPLSQYPKGPIAVSSWKRNNRELAILFNTSYKTAKIDITGSNIKDKLSNNSIEGEIKISSRGMRIIEFTP